MKSNAFDQFDAPAAPPQSAGGNAFDQFDAQTPAAPDVGMGESLARGFGQGATAGFSDEIQAGLAAGGLKLGGMLGVAPEEFAGRSLSDIYGEAKGDARGKEKAAQEANPGTYLTGDIAGSIAQPIPGGAAKSLEGLALQGTAIGGVNALGRSEATTPGELGGDVAQGGITGAVLNSALGKGAQAIGWGARKLIGVNPEKVQTFQDAGVRPTLADVTDSGVTKGFQNLIGETPFSAGVIDKGKAATVKDANKILGSVGLDVAKTQQGAGETIKSGLLDYQDRGRNVIGRLYNRLDSYIPGKTAVGTEPITKTIQDIQEIASTPGLREALDKSAAGKLMTSMQSDIEGAGGTLPYDAVKQYRTKIGRELKDVHLLRSEDEAVFDKLYGGLSETMKSAAAARGPAAMNAFEKANSVNAAFQTKLKEQINPLLKRADTQELFNKVLTNQKIGAKSQSLMDSLGAGEKQVVRGSLIKQLGENNVNEFDPVRAATRIAGLEPEARSALTSGLSKPQAAQFDKAIDALLLAKGTAAKGNPSRSLYSSIGGVSAVAGWHAPTTTLSLLAGAHITARLMTNQKFIGWLAGAPSGLTSNATKYIGKLSAVAAGDPDVQKFLDGITGISDAQAAPAPMPVPTMKPDNAASEPSPAPQQPLPPPLIGKDYLNRLERLESGGNPNAKATTSSASGSYGFTNGTWKAMVDKYGKDYGVTLKDKNNREKSGIMAELLTKENAAGLQKGLGRAPSAGELYIAHFLGKSGAVKLINNYGTNKKAATLFPDAARANKTVFFDGGRPRSVEEVYQLLHSKMAA